MELEGLGGVNGEGGGLCVLFIVGWLDGDNDLLIQ